MKLKSTKIGKIQTRGGGKARLSPLFTEILKSACAAWV